MVREHGHGAHRRALVRRGVGGALPRLPRRDGSPAPAGDLASGAGADGAGGGRGAGLRAALGGAAGGPLQRLRPRGAGRPAAAQRPPGEPAHPGVAGRLGPAAEEAARRWRGVERPQGGGVDGAAPRPGGGASAARLGRAATARLVAPGAAAAAPARGVPGAEDGAEKKLARAVARAAAEHPGRPVEVWAEDEHRLGLKPIRRRVWAPIGARPVALGHHRYEWLQVVAFVQPTSGETVWYLAAGLSKPFFEALLAAFARQVGAGRERHIVLVLDNAGWHGPEGLDVPEGISLVFPPPYSPELQPAEHLWPLVDEPIVNRHFATLADLEAVVAERCRRLGPAILRCVSNQLPR